VWDTITGSLQLDLKNRHEVFAVMFSPDGRLVASSTLREVKIWDAELGTELQSVAMTFDK
jgi:WD40 repeat protein